jgi:hypothetical protein
MERDMFSITEPVMKLSLSKEVKRVGVSSPHLKAEIDQLSEKLYFPVF